MGNICFSRHRFPSEVIRHAVWLYSRFTVSYRDIEDLVAESQSGDEVDAETVEETRMGANSGHSR